MNYTIVAYRPDGSNSCRGCVTDSWSSDFELRHTTDRREVVKDMAEFLYRNIDSDTDDWEITLLFNGVPCDEYHKHRRLYNMFYKRAMPLAKAKQAEYLSKKAEEESKAVERRLEWQKEQDLKTLNRLKAQYETN